MRFFLFTALACLVCPLLGQAQIDSFYIENLAFKIQIPEKWTFISMASGLCEEDKVNVRLDAPVTTKKCFGSLFIATSKITPEEREKRSTAQEETDPLKIDNTSFVKEVGDFEVAGGYYDARIDDDSLFYTNGRGDFLIMKTPPKPKKKNNPIPIHHYSRWFYFPLNDSLEIVIAFERIISHADEDMVDRAFMQFSEFFFTQNKTSLDSLLKLTSPYRHEPANWPLDSLPFWNTQLKYPVVGEWIYDRHQTTFNGVTTHLMLTAPAKDSCDEGRIVATSELQNVDAEKKTKEKKVSKEYAFYLKLMELPPIAQEEYSRKTNDTARSKEKKRHYYFMSSHSTEERTDCNNVTRYFDTVHVFIQTADDKRIDLMITFAMSSTDNKRAARYYHDLSRFITAFIDSNDFEQIYLLNKLMPLTFPFEQKKNPMDLTPDNKNKIEEGLPKPK